MTAVKGSCHCGFTKYSLIFPERHNEPISVNRCNCTWCTKLGTTSLHPEGPSAFELFSPSSKDQVPDYNPKKTDGHRYFCDKCGVHVWAEGSYEYQDQKHDFFTVNAATIDQPQDGVDLSEVKVSYWGGLHDNWPAGLKDKPYQGGLP